VRRCKPANNEDPSDEDVFAPENFKGKTELEAATKELA